MRPETRVSMNMLFAAKWNVPQAANHCGLTWKEMKITFNEFCRLNPLPDVDWGEAAQREERMRGNKYFCGT